MSFLWLSQRVRHFGPGRFRRAKVASCRARWVFCALLVAGSVGSLGGQAAGKLPLVWPSPNRAFLEGKPIEDFIQPTASGRVESGLYGCVRNGGRRFHEAIDIKVVERDRNGRPMDPAFAAMPGRVVYTNEVAGNSSFGKYVVLEHESEGIRFYTLYSHLNTIAEPVEAGVSVEQGAVLGIIGSTAGGYVIPQSRAHLHFEMGLQLDADFAWWYERKGFGSKNQHGPWNGMNLAGWDPLRYYRLALDGEISGPRDFLRSEPVAVRVRVAYRGVPDLARRSPGMVEDLVSGTPGGWEIDFSRFGVPLQFRRVAADRFPEGERDVEVVAYDPDLAFPPCRDLLDREGDGFVPGRDLARTMELIFGR